MKAILAYVTGQLASPTTHLALAAVAAAAVPVLPHDWGLILAGIFGGATASRKILWVQAVPGAVALWLVCASGG